MAEERYLDECIIRADTSAFIFKFAELVENGFFDFGEIDEKQAQEFRGHSKVQIVEKEIPICGTFCKHT